MANPNNHNTRYHCVYGTLNSNIADEVNDSNINNSSMLLVSVSYGVDTVVSVAHLYFV